jgi:hypothetical protein
LKFQTEVPLFPANGKHIDFDAEIVLLGSCFTEHISDKLDFYKFNAQNNPFGILFHPRSILTFLTNVHQNKIDENAVFFADEQWKSFDAHSRLNYSSKTLFLNQLTAKIEDCKSRFKTTSHFIITLGTAWSYRHLESQKYVSNCHKLPSTQFEKVLFSVDDITTILIEIRNLIHDFNPKAELIFTVSPVRHLKDGYIENSQSKAHLISAIHQVVHSSDFVHYFPSYEIMMDELRDYRFYKPDMIHPSTQAIEYIWEKFKSTWIDSQLNNTLKIINSIQIGLQHKPINPNSEAHKNFLKSIDSEIDSLKKVFPQLKF